MTMSNQTTRLAIPLLASLVFDIQTFHVNSLLVPKAIIAGPKLVTWRSFHHPVTLHSHPPSSCPESNSSDDDKNIRRRSSSKKKKKGPKARPKKERPRIPILQYHNDWVCINKPPGLSAHRARSTPKNQLVVSTLLKRQLSRKVFLVHRLDHRTSGVMLFAFNAKTCGLLHKALTFGNKGFDEDRVDARDVQEGLVAGIENGGGNDAVLDIQEEEEKRAEMLGGIEPSHKQYVALLRGDWKRSFGDESVVTIDKPLKVKDIMKEAETEFQLLASFPGIPSEDGQDENHSLPSACSLVLCLPKTGRTHQIRRHAYRMGFPVIGDSQHGDSKINRWWRENRGLNRLFLHCFSLDLPDLQLMDNEMNGHQDMSKRIECVAPLLPELSNVLKHESIEQEIWETALRKEPRLGLEPIDQKGGSFGRNFRNKQSEGV